jgi:iron complex outermembrane receptor protein
LGAGLRYFHDDQNAEDSFNPERTATFHALNPRAYAEYKLTHQVNVYASAAKGFRSGGFNSFGLPVYEPESLWTYELGTKMSLLGGHLSFDTDLFLSNYTNYIVNGTTLVPGVGAVNLVGNGGRARIKGVEAAVTWRPVDQWSVSFSGDYLDAKFVEIPAGVTRYVVGDRLDLVPTYQFTVAAQRDFKWNSRPGFARLDYAQQGHDYYRDRGTGPWYFDQSDIINMLNFNASLDWNESLRLGVFTQNLLNDRGFTSPINIEKSSERARPRTFGIQFGVKFD